MKNVLYVGIDVDEKNFHVAILGSDESIEQFKIKANASNLIEKLKSYQSKASTLRCCYESTYLGFSLARRLSASNIDCTVIASGLIPDIPSKKVKTDRLDSCKLAQYFKQGLLTEVAMPDEGTENDRDLIRSRNFLKEQIKSLKLHIGAILKRADLRYQQETGYTQNWTPSFRSWMNKKIKDMPLGSLRKNLEMLVSNLNVNEEYLEQYDQQIAGLAQTKKYQKEVNTLVAFKGVQELTAMTFICELGDIKRFSHPKKLTSYLGFDVTEYSSGGKEKKYGITKMGNKFVRTLLIESAQFAYRNTPTSKYLAKRRANSSPQAIEIAERCQSRLAKKASRMLFKDKARNIVKVACAREMSCFMWEALSKAA